MRFPKSVRHSGSRYFHCNRSLLYCSKWLSMIELMKNMGTVSYPTACLGTHILFRIELCNTRIKSFVHSIVASNSPLFCFFAFNAKSTKNQSTDKGTVSIPSKDNVRFSKTCSITTDGETLFFPFSTLLLNCLVSPFQPFYLASFYVLISISFSLFSTFTDRLEPFPTDEL